MPSPLLRSTLPICSTERAAELGFDIARTATCAQHKKREVAGCPVWEACRFHRKEYGGFKGTRPHFIGVFLRDMQGGAKRDQCACFTFVSAYQPVMDFGLQMRNEGKPNYPVVKIVAQEGDTVKMVRFPQTVNKAGQLVTQRVVKDVVIPPFPDPTEMDENLEFENELLGEYDDDAAAQVAAPRPGAPQAERA